MSRAADPRGWRAACVASVALLLVLSAAAMTGPLPGDLPIRDLALGLVPSLHGAAAAVNLGGTWRVLLPAIVVLLAASTAMRERWWLWSAALMVAPALEGGWKTMVGRARPQGPAFGFPSGHVTAVAAFGVILLYAATRVRAGRGVRAALVVAGIVGPAAVGAARLLLDAHWLSDVVGGGLLGASCATAAAWWDAGHPRERSLGEARPLASSRTG